MRQLIKRFFKQAEYADTEHIRKWFANVSLFREIVFNIVESAIIVAALEVAVTRTNHIVFWIFWLLSFSALTIYLQVFVRYVVNSANDRFDVIKNPTVFSYVAGCLALAFSASSVFVVSNITSAFIVASFMQ